MYRTFKLPKGKNTSYSLRRLWYRFFPRRIRPGDVIEFSARILTEPYDIRPDKDQSDRHKLFGVTRNVFGPSNKDAAMVSFQANPEQGTWDITQYFNYDKKWVTGAEGFLQSVTDELTGQIIFESLYKIKILIYINGAELQPLEFTWDKPCKYVGLILPWHGGKDNDGNGIGGVSPIDLIINLNWKWKRKTTQ